MGVDLIVQIDLSGIDFGGSILDKLGSKGSLLLSECICHTQVQNDHIGGVQSGLFSLGELMRIVLLM